MTCFQSETLIQCGLDGRLTPPERARLDAHLDHCPACRASWAEARALARAADAWARPGSADDPGEDFTARVMAQVARQTALTPRPALLPGTPAWGLAALSLLALSVWAGPWVGAHLPAPSLPVLPHVALAAPDVASVGRLAAQSFAQWAALPSLLHSAGIGGGGGLRAALTAAVAVNGWFALRALRTRGPQETAAR